MSHELRTPLNAIIGFSQVMADEIMGPLGSQRYVGYARDICSSAQHLLGIISDILDVSKLEAGKVELDEEETELPTVMRDVMQLVGERARALEIGIDIDLAPDLPRLRADPLKLKQVLLNLVTNAVKFSQSGDRVLLSARFDHEGYEISVMDHGIGMDPAEIETAITRFGQVASAWSRRHPGTGLGLPLAIGLVELHGGRLSIESRKGVGTTVTFTLPRARALTATTIAAVSA
jgi:signal transduction histidine kinase